MSDGETVRGKLPPVQIEPGTKVRYLEHLAVKPEDLEHWQIQNKTGAVVGLAQRDGAMAGGTISGVIYDDEAAAVPEEQPAGYDLDTCSQKHSRMAAHQAQRIDHLERIVQDMEADINRLMTFVNGQKIALRVGALEQVTRPILEAQSVGGWLHGLELQIMRFNQRLDAIERTLEDWSAGR